MRGGHHADAHFRGRQWSRYRFVVLRTLNVASPQRDMYEHMDDVQRMAYAAYASMRTSVTRRRIFSRYTQTQTYFGDTCSTGGGHNISHAVRRPLVGFAFGVSCLPPYTTAPATNRRTGVRVLPLPPSGSRLGCTQKWSRPVRLTQGLSRTSGWRRGAGICSHAASHHADSRRRDQKTRVSCSSDKSM